MSLLEKHLENERPWWELERREFIPLYGWGISVEKTIEVFNSATDKLFNQEREDLHCLYRELLFHRAPRLALSVIYNVAVIATALDYLSK